MLTNRKFSFIRTLLRWRHRTLIVLALLFFGDASGAMASPRVVVSIQPLHSIVSSVMQGVAQPELLVSAGASPHGFAMKPSQARLLQNADAIFWVGASLERFLVKPLQSLSRHAVVTAVSKSIALLPNRGSGIWSSASHREKHDKNSLGDHKGHGRYDPHFWLDPSLVSAIVPLIVRVLSQTDRRNAAQYKANGEYLLLRLKELDERLRGTLQPVKAIPFLVFHDAFQYFERRYQLRSVGAFRVDPERRPGARHLSTLRRRIARGDIKCIFREPHFLPPLLKDNPEKVALRVGVLKPLGVQLASGPDAYFKLMENLAETVATCLHVPKS